MKLAFFIAALFSNLFIANYAAVNEKKESQSQKSITPDNSFASTLNENKKCELLSSKYSKQNDPAYVVLTLMNNAEGFLNNVQGLLSDAKKYASVPRSYLDAIACERPADCFEVKEKCPSSKSGVFQIWPRNRILSGAINVYCDMEDDGGAWTVIQRRGDFDSGKEYFYEDWNTYKIGFGNLEKDFWLGNDNIFALTNQKSSVVKFTLTDWEGNTTYATYDDFWIDSEEHKYRVHFKGYRGTAGDSFSRHNGKPFTTKDQNNDANDSNCATRFKGAWWYTNCHDSNLNGNYLKGPHESHADGVNWRLFRGHKYSLKDTVIKIRPMDFNPGVNAMNSNNTPM